MNTVKLFKMAARFAIYLNRTLVLSPFVKHRSDVLVPFTSTFDANKLSQIVSMASMEEFRRSCRNKVDFVLHGTHPREPQFLHFKGAYLKDKLILKRLLHIDLQETSKRQSRNLFHPFSQNAWDFNIRITSPPTTV